jgi:hypothetical protein
MFKNAIILYGSSFWETAWKLLPRKIADTPKPGPKGQGISLTSLGLNCF